MECLTGRYNLEYRRTRGFLACQAAPRTAFMEIAMKRIPLSQGQFALIDNIDFETVSRFKWHVKDGYARTTVYLGMLGGKPKSIHMYLHRLILHPPIKLEVDHINHNKLDCRREKMRICTHQENQHNQSLRKGNSSRFKGVRWDKSAAKWNARISYNNKKIHLGMFHDEAEAGMAYDAKAQELFGDFANCNFD